MMLLNGATITLHQEPGSDGKPGKFTAGVSVGGYTMTSTGPDPVRALGLAVMLQAGYTEDTLKAALLGVEQ